jgi:hypothetical protein
VKKAAVFILLITLLISAFMPCCVIDNCTDEQNIAASHQKQAGEDGDCSPLFTCPTCPGFMVITKLLSLPGFLPEKIVHHEKTVSFSLPSYSSKLLQPPRMA